MDGLGQQVGGPPGTIGWASSPLSPATREHLVGRVAVAAGEALVGVLGHALDARQVAGVDRQAQRDLVRAARGASRASRSTSRSTVIFAIRRQVVSLPPVIVTIPLEVSYSSALREMSTDFFGSPVEISGRTPA